MKIFKTGSIVIGMLALSGCAGFDKTPNCCDGGYEYRHRNVIETKAPVPDDRDARIAALENELRQRDTRMTDLEREKQRLADELAAERNKKAAMGDMSARVRELEQQLAVCQEELARLKQQLAARDEEIARLKAQLASAASSLAKTEQDLLALLKPEVDKGNITVKRAGDTLTINLASALLFDAGQDQLKPAGVDVMKRVGGVLSTVSDKKIEVSGHSDNVPITGKLKEKFPTNLELSKARADHALGALGVSGTAVGLADTKPIVSNATPAGRAKNRRVEIAVSPK